MSPPIFIIGRQHSGNTMLARCLEEVPDMYSVTGEGQFFEYRDTLEGKSPTERVANIISLVERSGVELSREESRALEEYLLVTARSPGEVDESSPQRLYSRCMGWITRERGATRWAQKATSYVFYIDVILECFPEARLIFLTRNPLDLAASMKRRGVWYSVARMAYGWNKGTRLALQYGEKAPDNVLVVRYEDFVSNADREMARISSFCGFEFDQSYLEIPHVNRSESPYNRSSGHRGISNSRLGYYRDALSSVEQQSVRYMIDEDTLAALYPTLIDEAQPSLLAAGYAAGLAAMSVLTVGREHLSILLRNPRHAVQRMKKRIRA